jgi:hypothetical protein
MAASPLDRCKYLVSSRQASGLNTPRPGSSAPGGGGGGGRFRSLCFSGTSSLLARLSLYVADELLCLADDLVDNFAAVVVLGLVTRPVATLVERGLEVLAVVLEATTSSICSTILGLLLPEIRY